MLSDYLNYLHAINIYNIVQFGTDYRDITELVNNIIDDPWPDYERMLLHGMNHQWNQRIDETENEAARLQHDLLLLHKK